MVLLQQTGDALIDPLVTLWNGFATALPNILAAVVVLAAGYIVGSAFGFLFKRLLEHAKVDEHLRKAGVAHSIGFISIPNLAGGLLKWYVFALFLLPAAGFMKLGVLEDLLRDFALWLPNLLLGIIILLTGLIIADYIADRMLHSKRKGTKLLSSAARWFIILFVGIIALNQIGIDVSLAADTTLILVAGFALGLAIALGLGFGFAIRDEAKSIIKNMKKGL